MSEIILKGCTTKIKKKIHFTNSIKDIRIGIVFRYNHSPGHFTYDLVFDSECLFLLFVRHIMTVSGCDRELTAHFYSAASLKVHAPDT